MSYDIIVIGSGPGGYVCAVRAAQLGLLGALVCVGLVMPAGADGARLRGIDIDEQRIVSSTGALVLGEVPERLLVVGAGVIGLELGSVWRRLGSEVIVVEWLDRILPGIDNEVCRQVQRIFERQGMKFKLSSKVAGVETGGKKLKVTVEPATGGMAESIEADVV